MDSLDQGRRTIVRSALGGEAEPGAVNEATEATRVLAKYGATIYSRCKIILGDASASEHAMGEILARTFDGLARAANVTAALRLIYREVTSYCLGDALRDNRELDSGRVLSALNGGSVGFSDRDRLRQLVFELPEEVRAAVWLAHVDRIASPEIAEILEVPQKVVARRLAAFEARRAAGAEIDPVGPILRLA